MGLACGKSKVLGTIGLLSSILPLVTIPVLLVVFAVVTGSTLLLYILGGPTLYATTRDIRALRGMCCSTGVQGEDAKGPSGCPPLVIQPLRQETVHRES
jgi:hypothetical protein